MWLVYIVDVKRVIVWVCENIVDYGGDLDFIMIIGGFVGVYLVVLVVFLVNDLVL